MSAKRLKYHRFPTSGAMDMRVMKVYCPVCEARAVIKKTARKHKELSDLYCACTDVECGHTFVMNMTFSHTISPSAKSSDALIATICNSLDMQQKQLMLKFLSQDGTAAA
ncbi:ogr/Delta-like zinc finger family protein [Salmonella enterica subsp. enterica serovar Newport]|uniref:Transcriptional regulator n=3 Tax=Salmonella enterica TaxID=28901 RepID=A0A5W3HV43_SALNE|nr:MULTISPECIES: ogr/Delta-like zinc finger family protein [Enterobacteriaceae]EAA3803211.1 transcriptional regulator [Salmonella enterica subsp. enterica serovar Poona]EAA5686524.1 transcriptional regulator [Salmonella enterica subsp. enterica serovar Newport]EBG5230083.1 transcriptional regulator [Salmonella enterica subsp. enterica serovar Concord]EBH8626314.1 transcriptional regulator [Salmonella enterica subsp. enterica serovar Tees]EBY9756194.1 transcriptional regulator [Salmonella enter